MDFQKAVLLSVNGKEEGFLYLYQSTYQKSYYIALKYMKQEEAALDVLQDSYVKAFKNLKQLQDADKFPSWFAKIVASTALDALKKRRVLLFSQMEEGDSGIEALIEDERIDTQPELSYDKAETSRLVQEIIDTLSDEQRMCIVMFYAEEMSVKEIAETLGISENTVKSRLNYGRKHIKEKVLELEQKGTKLYTISPVAFFLYLLLADTQNAQAAEVPYDVLERTKKEIKQVSHTDHVKSFAEGTVKAGKTVAGIEIRKIMVGIFLLAVVGGSIAAVYQIMATKPEETVRMPVEELEVQQEPVEESEVQQNPMEEARVGEVVLETETEEGIKEEEKTTEQEALEAYAVFLQQEQYVDDGFCVLQISGQDIPMLILTKNAFSEEEITSQFAAMYFIDENTRIMSMAAYEFYYYDVSKKEVVQIAYPDETESTMGWYLAEGMMPLTLTLNEEDKLLILDMEGSSTYLEGFAYNAADYAFQTAMIYSDVPNPSEDQSNGEAEEYMASYKNSLSGMEGNKRYDVMDGSILEQSGDEVPSYETVKGKTLYGYRNIEDIRSLYLHN